MRRWTLVLVLSAATLAATVFVLYNWTMRSVYDEIDKTHAAVTASDDPCDPESEAVIERWSELGWSRSCVREGRRNGPWEAWSRQRLVIRGSYKDDLRSGEWAWYSDQGQVDRVIYYRDGQVVHDTELDGRLDKSIE